MVFGLAQFDRHLREAKALKPVYLLASSEPLLLIEAADRLRLRARELGYHERDVLNVEASFDWDDLARAGASLSLFASQRILDLRLPTGKPGAEGAAAIVDYCAHANGSDVLMISAMEWDKKNAGKWAQTVERAGMFVQIDPIYLNLLPAWIVDRARSRQLPLSPQAAQALADRVEGNLLAAAQEIDKLALLAEGRSIDVDRLQALVADNARFNVFALAEAALAGDATRVRRVLAGLRAEGEQVAGLLGWLVNSLALLLRAALLPRAQVTATLKNERVYGTRLQAYGAALTRGDLAFWERRLAELALVDRLSKGRADGDAWLALERVLLSAADRRLAKCLPRRMLVG